MYDGRVADQECIDAIEISVEIVNCKYKCKNWLSHYSANF